MNLEERVRQLEEKVRRLRPGLSFPSTATLDQRVRWLEMVMRELVDGNKPELLRRAFGHTVYIKSDRITLHSLTTDPISCSEGDLWYRSDLDRVKLAINSTPGDAKTLLPEEDGEIVTYRHKNIWNIRPVTLDGLTTGTNGSGSVSISNGRFILATGTTADSYALLCLQRDIDFPFGFGVDSRIFFQFCISNMPVDGFWAKLYVGTNVGITDTSHHYGFKFIRESGSVKCYATNADGSTEKTTEITGINFGSIGRRLEAVFTAGESVKFYVDGVLKATHTENLPTSTTPFANWYIRTENPGANSNCQIYVAQIWQSWDWW